MDNYSIRCARCRTLNRVPVAMEGRVGRCGSCGSSLRPLYSRPLPLDEKDFDGFLSRFPGPVLAEFYAPW